MSDNKRESHKSYGTIRLSRVNGGGRSLFMSPFRHYNLVSLTITQASKREELGVEEHMSSRGELIEVWMSEAQFAELITTWNRGTGAPCTIKSLWHPEMKTYERIPEPPEPLTLEERAQSVVDVVVEGDINHAHKTAEEALAILEQPRISKKDREALRRHIRSLKNLRNTGGSDFIRQHFGESLNRIVGKAKTEIHSAMSHLLQQAGLNSLKKELLQLPESKDEFNGDWNDDEQE